MSHRNRTSRNFKVTQIYELEVTGKLKLRLKKLTNKETEKIVHWTPLTDNILSALIIFKKGD
jgi:hypothetical protein